ncbi:MAG: alpha-amylase family glycosyl hydrolase [Bacteroidia bacterium]|nr:alpha-amylase family glycosyl hydrolase [Bacteroidia bacterium]
MAVALTAMGCSQQTSNETATMGKPIIYQIFTRVYGNTNDHCTFDGTIEQNRVGKLEDINDAALSSISEMGFTHVWYTGVIRHASTTNYDFMSHPANQNVVKGRAGSPYAICDYYDIDPDLAVDVDKRLDEFKALVERSHRHGLKVMIDFVPNHVARNYYSDARSDIAQLGAGDDKSQSFSVDNNFYYIPGQRFVSPVTDRDTEYTEEPAMVSGNDAFTASPSKDDWYETVKLNYGVDYQNGRAKHFEKRPDTWIKMRDILLYWIEETNIDGFRCDMVEMVPSEFWQWALGNIKAKHPNIIFMAESYNMDLYREYISAGFDLLYDKVNFYDVVRGVTEGNVDAREITNIWRKTEGIERNMVYFLENHDEQRLASDFFAKTPERGKAAMLLTAFMGKGATMLYFGQELGERAMDNEGFSGVDGRTTIFDYWSADAVRRFVGKDHTYIGKELNAEEFDLRNWYKNILNLSHSSAAFDYGEMFDLMYVNMDSYEKGQQLYAFLRYYDNERYLIIANFGAEATEAKIRIPQHAWEMMKVDMNSAIVMSNVFGQEVYSSSVATLMEEGVAVQVPAYDGVVLRLK